MKLVYPPGATPLDANEIGGLIPDIATQSELNELEKANIGQALLWARKSRKLKRDLLSISGLFRLHKEMFGDVWEWAGEMRKTEKNIGVAPHKIQENLHNLCEDVKTWIENETFHWDEIGVRFHHRLVYVHPFVNGNGRHARIAADLLLAFNSQKPFTWGSKEVSATDEFRNKYLEALRCADRGEIEDLLKFARL